MRAIDKLNTTEPEIVSDVVDKGYRDVPLDLASFVLDYFEFTDVNDIGKLIWLMFDNNYLDNKRLFELLEAAKINDGILHMDCFRKIIYHSDSDEIYRFMGKYLMDDPFYDRYMGAIEKELAHWICMDEFRFDHGNNSVNLAYLEWVLQTLGSCNDRAPDYFL
jgi:hypothetical protein